MTMYTTPPSLYGLHITEAEYLSKPADYRSVIDGQPYLLTLDRENGGTVLVPVHFTESRPLTDDEKRDAKR